MRTFAVGWRQVGACTVLLATVGMLGSTYGIIAAPLAAEFNPGRMVLMLAITVLSAVTGLLSPVLGHLMDWWPMRPLMAIGAACLAGGFTALSFATSFIQVLIVYGVLMALANVLIGPMAATVLLSRWFVRRRGSALGLAIAGVAMGALIFPPIIQALLDGYEWRTALRLLALLLLVLTAPAVALVVNSPSDRGLRPDGATDETLSVTVDAPSVAFSARALLADPAFWMIAAAFAVVLSGMSGMVTNLVPLATDEGISAPAAALLISIFAGCGVVAKLSFVLVADRLHPRVLLMIALGGFALGIAGLTQAESGYWIIALCVGLMGFFGGFLVPLQGLLIPRIWGQAVLGRVSGLFNLVVLCALLATPPLFGAVADLTGNYDAICLAFAALTAVCAVIVRYVRTTPAASAVGTPKISTPEQITAAVTEATA